MHRRTRLLLVAAAAGLLVPAAIDAGPASAVDQDLALTATVGVPGDQVTASSASCDVTTDGDQLRYLSVALVTGTGPDAALAGIAIGTEDQDATFVVPDWADPADDAVVQARCITVDFSGEEPVSSEFAYDPVPFDIQPGVGLPVQARTYSRTSLLAGQAFQVDGSGCFLDDAEISFVEVAQGSDLSFQSASTFVGAGFGEVAGDAFSVPVALSNGGLAVWISQTGDEPATVDQLEETPTDIAPGTYSSVSYCANDEGLNLVFEPQLIEVTGSAPIGEIDLTVPAQSRTATLAGESCTAGDVSFELDAYDNEDAFGPGEPIFDRGTAVRATDPAALSALRGPAGSDGLLTAADAWAGTRGASGTRALADEEYVEGEVTPNASGQWSVSDEVGFDQGYVEGYAWCGDPLADGFIYDPQAAIVDVDPTSTTVPSTVPVTTPPPAPVPADAVPGTPTYAG